MEWTDELLDKKRELCDPLADNAAASLFKLILAQDSTEGKKKVSKFISEFVSHDFTHDWDHSKHDVEIPEELFDYFKDMSPFEFTHEESKILERGSQFFVDHGPKAILILYARSLIKQYAHTSAIQVLRMTTLLEAHVHRRIIETMQFVVDVMNPKWHHHHDKEDKRAFNTNHVGKQSIQKLRLVHAMVRYKIEHKLTKKDQGEWEKDWGRPINQEDMIFATHTFSIEVIKGLEQLGTKLTKQERDDYYQTWSLIGRALGVDKDLIPDNYEEGVKLQNKIYDRHFTMPNKTGPVLSRALVDWLVEFVPLFNEQTALTLIKACNDLKGEHLIETNLGLDLGHAHDDLAEHADDLDIPGVKGQQVKGVAEDPAEQLIVYFIENLLKTERGGKQSNFRIGDGFLAAWNINEDREKPKSKLMLTLDSIWMAIKAFFLKLTGYFKKEKDDSHGGHE